MKKFLCHIAIFYGPVDNHIFTVKTQTLGFTISGTVLFRVRTVACSPLNPGSKDWDWMAVRRVVQSRTSLTLASSSRVGTGPPGKEERYIHSEWQITTAQRNRRIFGFSGMIADFPRAGGSTLICMIMTLENHSCPPHDCFGGFHTHTPAHRTTTAAPLTAAGGPHRQMPRSSTKQRNVCGT